MPTEWVLLLLLYTSVIAEWTLVCSLHLILKVLGKDDFETLLIK